MVQVVCALDAVLFSRGEAVFATTADATRKSNTDVLADLDIVADARSKGDYTADAFVATDVRKLDIENRAAVRARSSSSLCVKI